MLLCQRLYFVLLNSPDFCLYKVCFSTYISMMQFMEKILRGEPGCFLGLHSLWAQEGHPEITKVKTEVWVCSAKVADALQDYKGDLLRLGTCHKHNSWGRKGYSELVFILILFVSLLKQLPGLFWPQVLIPKRRLSANTTCIVEHTMSHCCQCVTFLSFIKWKCGCLHSQPTGCRALQMADTCVHNIHI